MTLAEVKVGDTVTRIIARTMRMELIVTHVTETEIHCGDWVFDRRTGAEIDDDLDWGPPPKATGSFLAGGWGINMA